MSNLDRYDFENFILQTDSEKIFLCHIFPKQRIIKWQIHAGSIYKRQVDFLVEKLFQTGIERKKVSDVSEVMAGDWFYDENDKTIYYRTPDSSDPSNWFIYVSYRICFASAALSLPYDLDAKRQVEYSPIILSVTPFSQELDEDNTGVCLESEGTIYFVNDKSFFYDTYDLFSFENCNINIYLYHRDLCPKDAKLIFSGYIYDKSYSSKTISLNVRDFFYKLRANIPLPLYSEADTVSRNLIGLPKRRLYGRIFGLKVQSLDPIREGFFLNGLFSTIAGSNIIIGNNDSEILRQCSFDDVVTIDGITTRIQEVLQDRFVTADIISTTNIDLEIFILPIPNRTRNRTHLIAHHSLHEKLALVTGSIGLNRFYIDNIEGFEIGDIIELEGVSNKIRRIVLNRITVETDFPTSPRIGDLLIKRPIYNVYVDDNIVNRDDYYLENGNPSILVLSDFLERNLAREKTNPDSLQFMFGSTVVTTPRINLFGLIQFTKNSNLVECINTKISGASIFTKGSKSVTAGGATIYGELTFTNGSNVVTTKRELISNNARFINDSKKVISIVNNGSGFIFAENGNPRIYCNVKPLSGFVSAQNGSYLFKTKSTSLTGIIVTIQEWNKITAEEKSITGKAQFTNGSSTVFCRGTLFGCISVTFTNGSNIVTGVNTFFTERVEVGKIVRINPRKNYKVFSIQNNNQITLVSAVEEDTKTQNWYEVLTDSEITSFLTEIDNNFYIKPQGGNYIQVSFVLNNEALNLVSPYTGITMVANMNKRSVTHFFAELSPGMFFKPLTHKNYIEIKSIESDSEFTLEESVYESSVTGMAESTQLSWMTKFTQEINAGDFVKRVTFDYDVFYKVSSVSGNAELVLETEYNEGFDVFQIETSKEETKFLSELSLNNFIEIENNHYQIVELTNNVTMLLNVGFFGETGSKRFNYSIEKPSFLSEIEENEYIRPNGNFSWYKVKKIISDSELELWNPFIQDIDSIAYVSSSPTFLQTGNEAQKVLPGELIKTQSGSNFFEVAQVYNDYELQIASIFNESTQSGESIKSTDASLFLSELSEGDFIKPVQEESRFSEVETILGNASLLLKNEYIGETTGIVSVVKTINPSFFMTQLKEGNMIASISGVESFEVLKIIDDGRLQLIDDYLLNSEQTEAVAYIKGNFFSVFKNRDWIKSQDSAWYEILQIQTDSRLLLREPFRGQDYSGYSYRKNIISINDDSNILLDCLGKTIDEDKNSPLIKTCSGAIKDLLLEANLKNLDLESFEIAEKANPALVSMMVPFELGQESPILRDVINSLLISSFSSLHNTDNFFIAISSIQAKKPLGIKKITDYDVIDYEIQTKSLKIIKSGHARYKHSDVSLGGKLTTAFYKSKTSEKVSMMDISEQSRTLDCYLYHEIDAEVFVSRLVLYNEIAKSITRIKSDISLFGTRILEPLLIDFSRLYRRFGTEDEQYRVSFVSKIRKGNQVEIILDDISNLFSRASSISKDDYSCYNLSTPLDRVLSGYITNENGMIDNMELTKGINIIT